MRQRVVPAVLVADARVDGAGGNVYTFTKCLHVPSNRVYISRDVIFEENLFPFSNMPLSSSAPPTNSTPVSPGKFDDAAYSFVLLPNHGAGTGHGARLELLDAPSA
jgi:hypothetical protein